MKNEKTTLNDRLFTTKCLPSKNIYPPKDLPTSSICNIHCPTLAFSPCHRTWLSWNNPIGIRWQTPRWVLWSNPFSRVPMTLPGVSHPERELESVCLCTYYALIYFPKVMPGFCRGTHVFVVNYRELFHMGIVQWQSVHRILFKSGFPLAISSVSRWCLLLASVKSRCKGNILW